MSELKNKLVIRALIGAILGMLISLFICVFANDLSELEGHKLYLIIQVLGSGIYGAIPMGGTICYKIEKWSLLKATLIHYCMTMAAFLTTNALLEWFSWSIIIYVLLAMTIGFFMIWFAEYIGWKKTIKRMNHDLAGLR